MSSEFEDRGLFLICVLGLDYPSLTPIRFLCVSFSPFPHSLVCVQILNRMMAILPTQNSSLYYGSAVSLRDRVWRQNVLPSFCFFFLILFTYFGIFFLKEVAFYYFNFKLAEELEKYKHELLCALVTFMCAILSFLFAQTYAYVCKACVYIYCAKHLCIYACMYTHVCMCVYTHTHEPFENELETWSFFFERLQCVFSNTR